MRVHFDYREGLMSSEQGTDKEADAAQDNRQVARLLETAAVQIRLSLSESDGSIFQLTEAIANSSNGIREIRSLVRMLGFSSHPDDIIDSISDRCSTIESKLQDAVVAMQFYDRLSQRFSHIQENVEVVAKMLECMDDATPEFFDGLYKKMRSVYSLEQERQIHDLIMNDGASQKDFAVAEKLMTAKQGDVELF